MPRRKTGAAILRARLKALRWSQSDLAKQIGVEPGPVSRWLTGARTPSLEMACRIQAATGVPVDAWRGTGTDG